MEACRIGLQGLTPLKSSGKDRGNPRLAPSLPRGIPSSANKKRSSSIALRSRATPGSADGSSRSGFNDDLDITAERDAQSQEPNGKLPEYQERGGPWESQWKEDSLNIEEENRLTAGQTPAPQSLPRQLGQAPARPIASVSNPTDVLRRNGDRPAPSPSPLSSSIFSDSEDDGNPASKNGSWTGQSGVVGAKTLSPWPADSGLVSKAGKIPPWNGSVKGLNMDLRGRQSVLGSATMQGSRFEPGHGDTSWINSMSPDWFPVIPVWQAPEKAAMASEPFLNHMAQGWRLLLLSDGSVTRHLHLMTGHKISVDCLEMRAIGHSLLGVPPGTALVAGPRVQRQALLKTKEGTPLAYAASWWAEYEAKMHLQEVHTPIWIALQEQRMELFRSLECLYYGHSRELERLFGKEGPFWARHYLFYHNGRPLTLIYEVFSPALEEWLGDSDLPEDLYLP